MVRSGSCSYCARCSGHIPWRQTLDKILQSIEVTGRKNRTSYLKNTNIRDILYSTDLPSGRWNRTNTTQKLVVAYM